MAVKTDIRIFPFLWFEKDVEEAARSCVGTDGRPRPGTVQTGHRRNAGKDQARHRSAGGSSRRQLTSGTTRISRRLDLPAIRCSPANRNPAAGHGGVSEPIRRLDP